ncbi:hypothetical protein JRI60_50010 [Archangium violaceum]|uniref:hypothetical protein n=1 Tax=Archangium violaceum TaxID=83451 RepID=UPI001950246B|nr:hypothetical protein [Archangium violaceum]QRN97012.1 hypothetical protein JRI60_50010 [Archangium violaceum]
MSTLPNDVMRVILNAASAGRGSTANTDEVSLTGKGAFRAAWGRALLRTYHCTRLLPHEVEMIRNQGLRRLTQALMHDRIEAARQSGVITEQEAAQLQQAHVFATRQHRSRMEQVWLIAGRIVFDNRIEACIRFLSTWGGEALYKSKMWPTLDKRISTLGTPSIVVADIDIYGRPDTATNPDIFEFFVDLQRQAEHRSADDVYANVIYKDDVPAKHVVGIWQPGHREYDRHAGLPRT